MKHIADFARRFGAALSLDERFIVEKADRFFLLNGNLRSLISDDFYCAGTYLGKTKGKVFFPSFSLLAMIAEKNDANKIIVDAKTEWLFICGRDIFSRGIKRIAGTKKKGELTLVLNAHDECLGFGKIMQNLDSTQAEQKVAAKNISDIGDFLRRER